jgi:hypothetical protein
MKRFHIFPFENVSAATRTNKDLSLAILRGEFASHLVGVLCGNYLRSVFLNGIVVLDVAAPQDMDVCAIRFVPHEESASHYTVPASRRI